MKLFVFTIICAIALFVWLQIMIYFFGVLNGILSVGCILAGYWIAKND